MAKPYIYEWGWCVFPVSRSKAPLIDGGCHQATTNLDMIEEWSDRFPHANIAVATGEINGIVVLDVDHPTGTESLRRIFELEHEPFEPTPMVRSGGGGAHYYFIRPLGPLKNSAGKVAPGIDIRSDGGSIIAPPSIHSSGRRYEWVRSPAEFCYGIVMPAPMPLWLRSSAEPRQRPTLRAPRHFESTGTVILDMEERELRAAKPGTRNHALNRAAFVFGQFIAAGKIDETEARSRLLQAGLAIGLGELECHGTIDSGISAGLANPRD